MGSVPDPFGSVEKRGDLAIFIIYRSWYLVRLATNSVIAIHWILQGIVAWFSKSNRSIRHLNLQLRLISSYM